ILNHKMESLSLWDYVRPYLGRKSFAIFDLKDPRPFFEQWKRHMGNMIRKRRNGGHSPARLTGVSP
ncbi:MAG: hypothetical protein LLG93_19230, partial [Deltaproteobacteria bacterium]|nr:hypothetical protein [Deltaproteobacteria bacterium]